MHPPAQYYLYPIGRREKRILLIVGVYALAGTAWILLSDSLLSLILDRAMMDRLALIKGLLFVYCSAMLLAWAMGSVPEPGHVGAPVSEIYSSFLWGGFLILAVVIAGVAYQFYRVQSEVTITGRFAQLRSAAQLQAVAISYRLTDQRRMGELARQTPFVVDALQNLHGSHAAKAKAQLHESMQKLQAEYGYAEVHLLDGNATPLVPSVGGSGNREAMLKAVTEAKRLGSTMLVDVHLDVGSEAPRFGFASPLMDSKRRLLGVLVSETDVNSVVFRELKAGALPEELRGTGEEEYVLSHYDTSSPAAFGSGATTSLAKLFENDQLPGFLRLGSRDFRVLSGEARDASGRPVLVAAAPISQTPWIVVARLEREVALRPLGRLAAATLSLTLLLLGLLAGSFALIDQRRKMRQMELERKHLTALQENQRLRHHALEAANLGVWTLNLSTGSVALDERAKTHVASAAVSTSFDEIVQKVHPEDRMRVKEVLTDSQTGRLDEQSRLLEFRIAAESGRWRHLELTLGPLVGAARICVSKDVSSDRLAALTLSRANRDLARAQRIGRIGSWRLEIDSGRLEWSHETYQIFGLPIETPIDLPTFIRHIHPDDREAVEVGWQAALAGKSYDLTHRLIVHGDIKWIHEQAEFDIDGTSQRRIAYGIAQDITVYKNTTDELRESQVHLRALAERVEQVREEERTRIAREIHDELGQVMTALKMELGWLQSRLLVGQPQLAKRVDGMLSKIDESVRAVRRISHELRPAVLDTLGLAAAVESLAGEFRRRMGVRCVVTVPAAPLGVSTFAESCLFRIAQELLTNVGRHSGASRVEVELGQTVHELVLRVSDNGRGIRQWEIGQDSLGLLGVRERVTQIGGRISIGPMHNSIGTSIVVTVPATA